MPNEYTYFVANLIIGTIFAIVYWQSPKLRREMVVIGLGLGVLSVLLSQTFIRDYWTPQFLFGPNLRIEEFLYGFFLGGVAAVIYSAIEEDKHHQRRHKTVPLLPFLITVSLAITILLASVWYADLSSIHVALLILLLTSVVVIGKRNDLVFVAFVSGILTVAISLFGFILLLLIYPQLVDVWWNQAALSGYRLAGVPVEELFWAFFLGFCAGPVYELRHGLVYKNKTRKRAKSE